MLDFSDLSFNNPSSQDRVASHLPSTRSPMNPHRWSLNSLQPVEIKLGQILMRQGLVDSGQLETVLRMQRQDCSSQLLGELLLQQGLISATDLEAALREQYWRYKGFWIID